jgi:hypothetical protein
MSKGLNYHELSHILYTDYSGTILSQFYLNKYREYSSKEASKGYVEVEEKDKELFCSSSDFMQVINMLEDGRIETFFSNEYPRAKYYFTFCASQFILNDLKVSFESKNKNAISNYALIFGRKFMWKQALKIRKLIDNNLVELGVDEHDIDRIEEITDEYISEVSLNKRLEFGLELANLFEKYKIRPPMNSTESIKSHNRMKGMKEKIKEAVEKALEQMKEQDKLQKEEPEEESENGENQEGEEGEESDENENGSGKCDGDGNEELGEQKSDVGSGSDESKGEKSKNVIDELQASIDNSTEESEAIQNEVNNDLNVVGIASINGGETYSGELFRETEREKLEIAKVYNLIKELRGDLAMRIDRFKKRGLLDTKSAMKSIHNRTLNVFKKKSLNKMDKARLGISLILDTSGSISDSDFNNEVRSAWTLVKSFEKLENKVEVIEFSDSFRVLKPFNSEGDWRRTFNAGTVLTGAFNESISHLDKLDDIKNKYIIIISDGDFTEKYESTKRLIEEAHNHRIKVFWILASRDGRYVSRSKDEFSSLFDHYFKIEDLSELSVKLQKTVSMIQRDIIARLQTTQ